MQSSNNKTPVCSVEVTKDLSAFNTVKTYLQNKGAQFTSDITGLDQRYASFSYKESNYTLSLDNYMGIQIDCYSNKDKVVIRDALSELNLKQRSKL